MLLIKKRRSADAQNPIYNKFLEYYLLNLRKCIFRTFPKRHFWKKSLKKKQPSSFRKHNLVFLIAACTNSLVDNFPYNYMSCFWSLIWLILNSLIRNNCSEFRSRLLDSYFFKLTLRSNCLKLYFWTVAFKTTLTQ